ncbi:MAG: N-6 DNA methylase [Candidatus Aenigmatarchaeota archaeon]
MGEIEVLKSKLKDIGLNRYSPQTGDEADFVDRKVVMEVLLPWLGWESCDYEYNTTKLGKKPDFLIKIHGRIAFFIEDKSTTEEFDKHKKQISDYLTLYSEKGIVTNGFKIWVVKRSRNELVRDLIINLYDWLTGQCLYCQDEELKIYRFYELFSKKNFVDLTNRLNNLALNEEEFLKKAQSVRDSRETFILDCVSVIEKIRKDVYVRVKPALRVYKNFNEEKSKAIKTLLEELDKARSNLENDLFDKKKIDMEEMEKIVLKVGYLEIEDYEKAQNFGKKVIKDREDILKRFISVLEEKDKMLKDFKFEQEENLFIADIYQDWLKLWIEFRNYTSKEDGIDPVEEYALQTAFTFFVKVLILRILEDKKIISRIFSDGGFVLWREIIERLSIFDKLGNLNFDLLFRLATRSVKSQIFKDIEGNRIYDWYVPESNLLFLEVLEVLNKYKFDEVEEDLIGYIYERLMQKTHRHELGIYLTPPELVEYILDVSGYNGREILGKNVIDPACGSGSFLVHAFRRYKKELKEAYNNSLTEDYAKAVVNAAIENFYGYDINAFSIYLANLNMFLQILEEVHFLYTKGKLNESISFNLKVGNSLSVLRLSSEKFSFVFANPPYISPSMTDVDLSKLKNDYKKVISGATNTYIFFLKLAVDLLEDGGTLGFVVPMTLLGDTTTQGIRNYLKQGKIKHITKFFNRHMLFEGVTQAVIVFVWQKEKSQDDINVSLGLITSDDSRNDIIARAKTLTFNVNRISYSFQDREIWIVFNARDEKHYRKLEKAFESIYNKPMTLGEYLKKLKFNFEEDFKQGDISYQLNILEPMLSGSEVGIPIYKGKDTRPFGSFKEPEPLTRKGEGRDKGIPAYINCSKAKNCINIKRICELKEEEFLICINRIGISIGHPRFVKGTVETRSSQNKFILLDKIIWLRFKEEKYACKIAGLLFSLPFNFQYNAINTNTQITGSDLLLMKVPEKIPDEVIDCVKSLKEVQDKFYTLGIKDITELLDPLWYEERRNKNVFHSIKWDFLLAENKSITLHDFILRHGSLPKKDMKLEDLVKVVKSDSAKKILQLFADFFKNNKYSHFEHKKIMPDNIDKFLQKVDEVQKEINNLLSQWKKNLLHLDELIISAYELSIEPSDFLCPIIR